MLSRPIAIEAKPVLPPLWGKAGLTAAPAAARATPAASAHRAIIGVLEARERFGPRVPDRSYPRRSESVPANCRSDSWEWWPRRSEEHTSELQSPCNLVCRLLLEKKKKKLLALRELLVHTA